MIEASEQLFVAIADTTRRQLLINLAESQPKTATQLAQEFPISRQGIMKHLDLLIDAGLVTTEIKGREKRYVASPEPLEDVSAWIDELSTRWKSRLGRLKDFVENEE